MNIPVRRPVQGRSPEPTFAGRRKCMNRSSLTPEHDWLLASYLTNSGAGSDTLSRKQELYTYTIHVDKYTLTKNICPMR